MHNRCVEWRSHVTCGNNATGGSPVLKEDEHPPPNNAPSGSLAPARATDSCQDPIGNNARPCYGPSGGSPVCGGLKVLNNTAQGLPWVIVLTPYVGCKSTTISTHSPTVGNIACPCYGPAVAHG